MVKHFAIWLFISLITLTSNSAQVDSILVEEVEVRASSIPMSRAVSGRSVQIISEKELDDIPGKTIEDALQSIAGIHLNSRNRFGVQSDIGIRGSTFSQVLILIDGIRLNDPLTGHFNNNIPLALSEISRIEIVRGPGAASFGADAVGGMIHIITKVGEGQNSDQSRLTGRMALGENNLISGETSLSLVRNNWQISFSNRANISEGEKKHNPNFDAGISEESEHRNHFDLRSYSAAISKNQDNFGFYARLAYDTRAFKAKYFYTQSNYDESDEETSSLWSQAGFYYRVANHKILLNGGYKKSKDHFSFNPAFTPNDHTMNQSIINFSDRIKVSDVLQLGLGVQYINKKIESTDRGNHINNSFGAYADAHYGLSESFYLNGSLRFEADENFGKELLPQLSLSYLFGGLTFRASYGKSARAADFTERYVSHEISSLSPGRNIGNPDLKAEKSHTIDIGFDWDKLNERIFSFSAFYRTSKNLIDFSLRNSNTISNANNLIENEEYFYADNISEASSLGFELSGSKKIVTRSNFGLSASVAYTFVKTEAESGELSKYISNHPDHSLFASINIRLGRLSLVNTNRYISRGEETLSLISGNIPRNYFVSDISVNYAIVKEASVFIEVLNLSNTEYQEVLGAPLPGRWLLGGAKWNLGF